MSTDLREAARALLKMFEGGPQHIVDAVVLRKTSPEIAAFRAALAEDDGMVRVPREPKPGLLCGDVAVSTDPRYAGFVFVRHVDGVNWTTCAKMTPETWTMLAAAQEGKS